MYVYMCIVYRDSIIPVAGGAIEADYNNVGLSLMGDMGEDRGRLPSLTGKEEDLYTAPNKVVAALNLEVTGHKRRVSMYTRDCR